MNFFTSYINLLFFTLALLSENDYKVAEKITKQRDVMNLLATLMQVSEEKNADGNLKRKLLKGAARLMASLSAAREDLGNEKLQLTQVPNAVQKRLKDHTGLVMNFCLNLVSLKELGNLKLMIQTVGNLAVIKDIQQNQFLLKVGLQAVINKFMAHHANG